MASTIAVNTADGRDVRVPLVVWSVVAGLAIILLAVRTMHALFTPEPTQALTSGAEYESLYAIWKFVHGLTLYSDQNRIPFAGTYYNWLYYALYGTTINVLAAVFGLGDSWIPTITKLVTLAGALTGFAGSYVLSLRVLGDRSRRARALALAVWSFVFFGPLMGFWAIATAPDVWALAMDALAVMVFLSLYDRRPRLAIVLFAALAYGAWAFKQTFIYSAGAAVLFLAFRRDWRGAVLLIVFMGASFAASLIAGGAAYAKMVFFGGSQIQLSPDRMLRNMANFAVKCAPLIAAVGLLPLLLRPIGGVAVRRPAILFAALGIAVSAPLTVISSAKLGGSENYYFVISFHLGFLLLATVVNGGWQQAPAWWRRLSIASWALTGTALLAVLLGFTGELSVRRIHDSLVATARCVGTQPGPVFIESASLALPWMVPSDPAFVLHWNYPLDRAAGVAMEGGGVGGLIERGYFATVVLGTGQTGFDGGNVARHYQPAATCPDFVIYRRR